MLPIKLHEGILVKISQSLFCERFGKHLTPQNVYALIQRGSPFYSVCLTKCQGFVSSALNLILQ